ncbi:crotonobetainyl-CoA--carnitine CoA-transferase [Nocardia transvalensis]|uniref:crotonobetainyl-CoA--carnitine CoA-transferase n=1 Tax=Nocardia transvalensis TaxID=37333 RepID=UPI001E58DE8C|nr:crotonobetainyl-CoA--carnitine CoA-transferase [Nocardia transvalensis]
MEAGFADLAQAYIDRYRFSSRRNLTSWIGMELDWDEDYCRRVAAFFEQAPLLDYSPSLAELYDRFAWENLQQYRVVLDAGITVRPWLARGQPYRRSDELRASVRATGVLYVYPTSSGHGPGPPRGFHPMRKPSGVVADGVELCHNDVFRVVHDVFGHIVSGSGFSPRGEFKAAFCHMGMYSDDVHPVLFTEHIAQICWYFFGPHARERRYPPQKVFEYPRSYLDRFRDLFVPPRQSNLI